MVRLVAAQNDLNKKIRKKRKKGIDLIRIVSILINMIETDKYETTGFRFISRDYNSEPKTGDLLDRSFVWDGDEITEDELRGTCCFETREQIEEYAKWSKGTGWIVMIGGDSAGYGDDFVGEILIDNAEVLEVSVW